LVEPGEESEVMGVVEALELIRQMGSIDGEEADLTWCHHLKEEYPFAG
jgi:hypothetical protein